MSPLLSVEGLGKTYGVKPVIHDLSFSIEAGNRVTMFAPSGSGKTTLITILSRLDDQFAGTFHLNAVNPATLFQEPRLFSYMTIRENIFLPLRIRNVPITTDVLEHYEQWLAVCGLREFQAHYPYQISGGMKQKVSLIRGFLAEPDFMMMDEPFKSIDIHSKNRIIHHLIDTYPQTTILLVTHNLDEIPMLTRSLMLFKKNVLTEFQHYPDISRRNVSELFSEILDEFSSS